MPKVTITFDTSEPDEERNMKIALGGFDLLMVIQDLSDHLREHLRYIDHPQNEYEIYSEIKDKIFELADERGVKNLIFD